MNASIEVSWVDQRRRADGWTVLITSPSGRSLTRVMAAYVEPSGLSWPMPAQATRPAEDDISWDRPGVDFVSLANRVDSRQAGSVEATAYGRHLFDALLGPDGWAMLTMAAPAEPLVVGFTWKSGPLHRLVWELMHDGRNYLALLDPSPVVLLRLPTADPEPGVPTMPPATLDRPPRVLFAVGSNLEDRDVRAGAEVMGVLRDVERSGSGRESVSARVLTSASLRTLRAECARSLPDVVHLIGHGQVDPVSGVAMLTITDDAGTGQEQQGGAVLADALTTTTTSTRQMPTLVVVSACDGAIAKTEAGLPLASELVNAGVPIVVAMAGAISDLSCRVFTRTVVASVAQGMSFTTALATGRRAAFAYTHATPDKIDWALPAVFSRASLTADFRFADPTTMWAVREFIDLHFPHEGPLFVGRHDLFRDLDELLSPIKLGALVLDTVSTSPVGGTRTLRELAAEAVRLGHLPVAVGPFSSEADAPDGFEAIVLQVARKMITIAELHEGIVAPLHSLRVLAGADGPASASAEELDELLAPATQQLATRTDRSLVTALREDLCELRDQLVARYPRVFTAQAPPLLIFDDVHLYGNGSGQGPEGAKVKGGMDRLKAMLGPRGLGNAPTKLPVVLFGKQDDGPGRVLQEWRQSSAASTQFRFRRLLQVNELTRPAVQLALLSWLLNPPTRAIESWIDSVLAPNDEKLDLWFEIFMWRLTELFNGSNPRATKFYDPAFHKMVAEFCINNDLLLAGQDDQILKSFGIRQ